MFDLEYESQFETLLKDSHIVIANFYKDGENQSEKLIKSLEPYTKELSQYPDTVFVRIEKSKYPNLCEQFIVKETPALMIFHHEQPVKILEILADPKGKKTNKIVGFQKDIPQYLKEVITNLHIPAKK